MKNKKIKYYKYSKILNFYGIKFYNYECKKILRHLYLKGGYLVAPSASSLVNIKNNKQYYLSLKNSSIAILDSGFLCVLLKFCGIYIQKLSGYKFFCYFLESKLFKNKKILLVNPNKKEDELNINLLKKFQFKKVDSYICPIYKSNLLDNLLLKKIINYKPDLIQINIGGEKQEIIADFIKKNIKFKTAILCTGAAIAFVTRAQAPINKITDYLYFGWLIRLLYNPRIYIKKLIFSLKLINFFLKSYKFTYI